MARVSVLTFLTRAALVAAPVAGVVAGMMLFADGDGNSAQDPGVPVSEVLAVRFPSDVKSASAASIPPSVTERDAQSILESVALSPSSFVAALDALAPPQSVPLPPSSSRPDAVFNAAQIASFKERLKIEAGQESYWTPVEAALRELSWQRSGGRGAKPKLDPDSVQRLTAATGQLFAVLKDNQKREVRLLANVIGLKT